MSSLSHPLHVKSSSREMNDDCQSKGFALGNEIKWIFFYEVAIIDDISLSLVHNYALHSIYSLYHKLDVNSCSRNVCNTRNNFETTS